MMYSGTGPGFSEAEFDELCAEGEPFYRVWGHAVPGDFEIYSTGSQNIVNLCE